jgi:hypothetical protein
MLVTLESCHYVHESCVERNVQLVRSEGMPEDCSISKGREGLWYPYMTD